VGRAGASYGLVRGGRRRGGAPGAAPSLPGAATRLDAALTGTRAKIPDGEAEDEGVAFGKLGAGHIIDLRRDDGRGASVPFPARPRPGVRRPTPPGHTPASAWIGRVRPLLLDSPHQFRPGPPPALRSARYARDLHELAAYGGRTGSHRTPEQTDTARFFVALDLQGALGDHATRHGFDIGETARLYAAANTAQADAVITAWDAKLHHGTWRPVTALREADTDGNPATGVIEQDVVDARVWGGIHTRTADEVGNAAGRRLAAWALRTYFRPVP
jgi:hypothetical protein